MKKIIMVITTLALACGLMLGTMGTAAASTTQSGEGRGMFGTVESVDISADGTGTITLGNVKQAGAAENVTTMDVTVTGTTVYHIPTVTIVPKWQTWAQLSPESRELVEDANRVAVLLKYPASDHVAQKVMIVPAKGLCRYRHQLGTVAKVEGDTATIVKRNGEELTVTLGEGVELEAGQVVVLVTDKTSGEVQFRAVHAYRWENMVQRFEGYLNGSLNQASFDNATAALQRAHQKHINTLEALKDRLEERNRVQAAEAVGNAMQYAEARYAETIQLRDQIQERVREMGGWEEWRAQWGEANGTVASVSTQTRTMTLNTDSGPLTLQVAAGATITKNGNLYAFKGLQAGNVVGKVIYHNDTHKAWYIELQ
jgi:hypothetical protein